VPSAGGNPIQTCARPALLDEFIARHRWVTESVQQTSSCIARLERLWETGFSRLQCNSTTNADVNLLPLAGRRAVF
jgi:hypothetical protein